MQNKLRQPIYYLEGADGTGKSTLASEIVKYKKANMLHGSYDKSWDMKKYHGLLLSTAFELSRYSPVVLDRLMFSEYVYGTALRGKTSYNLFDFISDNASLLDNVIYIYCRNDNAIENHKNNTKLRVEMFDDMTEVIKEYENIVKTTDDLGWKIYDYDKVNMVDFVKSLPGMNYQE